MSLLEVEDLTIRFGGLSRVYTPTSGKIRFKGEDLLKVAPDQVAGLGIARTFPHLPEYRVVRASECAAQPAGRTTHPPPT